MKTRTIYLLLLLFVSTLSYAQLNMRLVSGVINDSDGDPVIGVSVLQKGTTHGTITDWNGYYVIIVPLGSTLQFTYIGMNTSEMTVTEKNSKPAPADGKIPAEAAPAFPVATPAAVPEVKPAKRVIPPVELSSEDKSLSPYFLVLCDSLIKAQMPLKNTDVTVNIAGVIADVCVKQIYINESPSTLEAIYVFPGSTRAAVYAMAMTIGERRIEARIKKKEQARQEYEEAKAEGKSATLLEQHRPNVFQMNVANILPGDTIVVEMRYTELLEHREGMYEFVYPTVVGPRYTETGEEWVARSTVAFEAGMTPQFSIQTILQAGMPIRKVGSPSHSLTVESPTADQAVVSLSNPKDFEGDRDYILQYELQGGKVESGLLCYEHGDENFFLLMVQPPKKPTIDQIPPREYVFIVDVSGSMYGAPLDISKELIRNLIAQLRPSDRFNVMLFESSNSMLYKESVAATKENIDKAMAVIDKRHGSGGTALYPAIQNAMSFKETEGFSRTFVIMTDGFVTVEKETFNYVRSHLNDANLFPFGIGSRVNRYIIEGLAHAGMGTPYIVTNLTQAEETGRKVIREISQPVLTNISVDWGGFDVYEVEPVAIPDVFAERPILIYGKYKGDAKGTITVSGNAGDTNYEQKFNAAKARKENNQALRYLWARNQIRYFDDYAQYYEGSTNGWNDYYGNHQRSGKQIETVTNLGLKYNLLTQYTSFLAVDEVVRQPKQRVTKDTYTPPLPKRQNISAPDFKMTEDASLLEEVVVVGYGTQKKSYMTGSVSSVSSNEISTSAPHALQGRVAGVQISQTSGEPGNPARIRIRGSSSMMGNGNPLVVLDGVPIEYNLLSQVNASDIESISVLKDASATAIYGSRGAYGVLIVTTKKASSNKYNITWSSSVSLETPNRLPDVEDDDVYDIFDTGFTIKNHLTLSGRQKGYFYNLKVGNIHQHGFIPKSRFTANSIGARFGKDNHSKFNYDIDLHYRKNKGNRLQRGYNMSNIMQAILLPNADPYWLIANNPFSDNADRFTGNLNLKYKLAESFTLNYQLNGDYLSTDSKTAMNLGTITMPEGHIMDRGETFKSVQTQLFGQFNENWDEHQLTAILGYEYNRSKRKIDRTDGYNLYMPGIYKMTNAETVENFNQLFKRHSSSIFGKATFDYKSKIIVEAAMRSEWSSITDKTLLSPSAGIALNLHNMFYAEAISQLKLFANLSRADKESPLYLDPVYFNSATYNLNDASHHFESREVILDDLKPERIMNYEIGANIGLLNNRLLLSTSWYWKRGKDQLLPAQVDIKTVQLKNAGAFKTHGFEAELQAFLIHSRNFHWNSRLIFSRERNKVTKLEGAFALAGVATMDNEFMGSYVLPGEPLGVLCHLRPGFITVVGDPNPDWLMSWSNTFEYKRFTLSMLFDYKRGGDMWNGTRNAMGELGFNIEDGTYLKLRDLSLSYRFPIRMFDRRTQLRLSLFATNILLHTKYKGVDPETNLTGASNGFGLDYFNTPGVKSFGVGLNWEF